MKKRMNSLMAMLIIAFAVTGCGSQEGAAEMVGADSVLARIGVEYSSEDLDGTWEEDEATRITLQGSTYIIDGAGAQAEGKILTISEAGTYVLSGTLTDGQIQVAAGEEDTVRLVLNGASLTSADNAALYSIESEKTILTLAEGSVNTISDGSTHDIILDTDEPDAAIYSKSDLTINGSGSLSVTGNYKNGIVSKDDLVITGGDISVSAINDGIKGKDSIAIKSGTFTLKVNGDGLQASNDEDGDKGWISLDGGVFDIKAGQDGIQAETQLQMEGAEINVTSGSGNTNAVQSDATGEAVSAKGLKAGSGILADGGSYSIDSSDDAVHSNGDIVINAGEFEILAGDDGIHADASFMMNGGTLEIKKSYEGLEASSITVNEGTLQLTASDDGFNAAGGNDGSSIDGRAGENAFEADAAVFIEINGGDINVDAAGDGIDSNGDLRITGGTIYVNGPTNNGNGAMDYNGECVLSGGTLGIAGSGGMAQAPGENSTQNSVLVYYTTLQSGGTLVTLIDEGGEEVFSFEPSKEYQSIVISTPDLKTGSTYTLLSGGTELTSITLSQVTTTISDDGSAYAGGQGGMGGQGHGGEKRTPPSGEAGAPPEGKVRPEGEGAVDGNLI